LGKKYYYSVDIEKDITLAYAYFFKAAKNGNHESMYYLAKILENGEGKFIYYN
jgi:TPR repeat protein